MKVNISAIEQVINSKPCKFCGKQHSVKFEGGSDPIRPAIGYSFSDDACEEFKEAVKALVANLFNDAGYPVTTF